MSVSPLGEPNPLGTVAILLYWGGGLGITNRAHKSAAAETAQNVGKKADMFNAENGHYPATIGVLNDTSANGTTTNSSWYLPTSSYTDGTPAADQKDNTVKYTKCPTTAAAGAETGATIQYFDYDKKVTATTTVGAGC